MTLRKEPSGSPVMFLRGKKTKVGKRREREAERGEASEEYLVILLSFGWCGDAEIKCSGKHKLRHEDAES